MKPRPIHSQGWLRSSSRFRRFVIMAFTVALSLAAVCAAQTKSPQNPKTVQSKTVGHVGPAANGAPQDMHAQQPTRDGSQNVVYVHPPESMAAPTAQQNPLILRLPPYEAPKVPFAKGVARPLPKQIPAGMYEEDTENLIRNWKNRRPMKEVKKAIHESLVMPSEPKGKSALPSREKQAKAAVTGVQPLLSTAGWEQIGYGDWNADGVHYQAGRIRQASYAYDNSQGITTLWLGATGGGVWRGVVIGLFAVAFVPMSDNLPGSPTVGAFLVQPGNSNNILIGTGDINRYGGTGMYQTTDGGSNWHAVNPTDGTFWPSSFQKILIDLNDLTNNTVLAQGDSGIWRATDFGNTWSPVYAGSTTDLVQDPNNPWIWYAGAPGTGVLRSTSYGTSCADFDRGPHPR